MEITGANTHDKTVALATLDSIVVERPEKVVYRLHHLCLDKGYDYADVIEGVEERDYHLHLAKSKADNDARRGPKKHPARRWVVERTHAWHNRFRRLLVRWEKKSTHYEAFIHVASVLSIRTVEIIFVASIRWNTSPLGRAGNSATADQRHVLDRALGYLPAECCCLLADREFIGGAWLRHLLEREVDFVIRLRCNHTIKRADGRTLSLARSTRNQAKGTTRVYEQVQLYEGDNTVSVHLICHRAANGQRVFLATTRTDFDNVVALYKQRWAAETAFGFLKSKGFDLEATRLRAPQRVLRLVGLLALGLLWTLCVGEHLHQQKPLPNKKHGYPAHSLFRRGLDAIQHCIAQQKQNTTARLYNIIRLLVSCS